MLVGLDNAVFVLLCVLYVWPVISHDAMQINPTRRFLTMLVYIPDCVITSKIPTKLLKSPFSPSYTHTCRVYI